MSEGRRPGGLTALAVINFVFGGLSGIGVLGLLGMAAVSKANSDDEVVRAMARALEEMGGLFYVALVGNALTAFLLISSGVGYLKQRKFWGRTLGNVYAVLSIASSLVGVYVIAKELGGGFNMMTILGLVYPVLTLILLNTTFKEDFIR